MLIHPVDALDKILATRARLNRPLYVHQDLYGYTLRVQDGSIVLECVVPFKLSDDTDNPDVVKVVALLPYSNAPVVPEEIRFKTHDYAQIKTWAGETTGDPAAWVVGGAIFNNTIGRWLDQYGIPITAEYDDVNYRWVDSEEVSRKNDPINFPYTRYAWLDQNNTVNDASCWRDDNNNIIVKFDPSQGQLLSDGISYSGAWVRQSDPGIWDVDVTSSRWVITPYENSKIELLQALIVAETHAFIQVDGAMHYRSYGYHPLAGDYYLLKDWDYPDVGRFEEGADGTYTSPITLPDHTNPLKTIRYNYQQSVSQVLDDRSRTAFIKGQAWRLDISCDNHRRILDTATAKATFVARKIDSF